jgi:transposase
MQRHSGLTEIYEFKQKLITLLIKKSVNHWEVKRLIPQLLTSIQQLQNSHFEPLVTLGNTLNYWLDEIACMWRFTKSNSITEGFHRKMKLIQRRAYGFKNFQNYRLRVRALCC